MWRNDFLFILVNNVDIDWEYPGFAEHSGTPQDTANFRLLLNDVRAKLDELGAETGKFYGLTAVRPSIFFISFSIIFFLQ